MNRCLKALSLSFACVGLPSLAQGATVHSEGFETDGQGSRYTASTPFNDGVNDHWNRTDGTDIDNTSAGGNTYTATAALSFGPRRTPMTTAGTGTTNNSSITVRYHRHLDLGIHEPRGGL